MLQRSLMAYASLRRCEVYASGPEWRVSEGPRANPVCVGQKASPAGAAELALKSEFAVRIQKLVMEATTRIELVYTVLQTVA